MLGEPEEFRECANRATIYSSLVCLNGQRIDCRDLRFLQLIMPNSEVSDNVTKKKFKKKFGSTLCSARCESCNWYCAEQALQVASVLLTSSLLSFSSLQANYIGF
jgi:hypothetical protein